MIQTPSIPDRTQAFLDTLALHAGKALIFRLHGETLVHEGYHVSEVKAVTIEAMDCGGRATSWRETVVQLWNGGGEEDRGFMTVEKFLAIYGKVASQVPVNAEAALRFEYGDSRNPTVQYRVQGVEVQAGQVLVSLNYPSVSCKPNDERLAAGEASGCATVPSMAASASTSTAPGKLAVLPGLNQGSCCG